MFEYIVQQSYFTERDASRYSAQIVSACGYLHDCGIVHLDVKPENLLIERPDTGIVKLVGFNKAQRLNEAKQIRIVFGNPEFIGMTFSHENARRDDRQTDLQSDKETHACVQTETSD